MTLSRGIVLILVLFEAAILSGCGLGICIERCEWGRIEFDRGTLLDLGEAPFESAQRREITLINVGRRSAENLSEATIEEPFRFVGGKYPGEGGTCGILLPSGESCSLQIEFAVPRAPPSDFAGTLAISYASLEEPLRSLLSIVYRSGNGAFGGVPGIGSGPVVVVADDQEAVVGGAFGFYDQAGGQFLSKLDSSGAALAGFALDSAPGDIVRTMAKAGGGDSDLFIGGDFTSIGSVPANRVAKLKSDGTVNELFDSSNGPDQVVYSVRPARDGSGDVYVGGNFQNVNGFSASRIVRLNSDGTTDPGFAVGSGCNNRVTDIEVDLTISAVYLVGGFTSCMGSAANRVVRLTSTAALDLGFSYGSGFNAFVLTAALAVDGSGDIYLGGRFTVYNGSPQIRIARLNSNGTIDSTFAIGTGFNDDVSAIEPALDGSGSVYVGGHFTTYNGVSAAYFVRLLSDGSLDSGFTAMASPNGRVAGISVSSNRIWVVGSFTRLGAKSLRGAYAIDYQGRLVTESDGSGPSAGDPVIVEPGGTTRKSLLLVGELDSYSDIPTGGIGMLDQNGKQSADISFGAGFNTRPSATKFETNGAIVVGGAFTDYDGTSATRIARLQASGALDTGFQVSPGANGTVRAIEISKSFPGKIYVGGEFTTLNGASLARLARLNSDGTIDPSFSIGAGFDDSVWRISELDDGALLISGEFSNFNGASSARIAKLLPSGASDPSFGPGSGFDARPNAILPLRDGTGRFYAAGTFQLYQGLPAYRIIRLNADGTRDGTFPASPGANASIRSLSWSDETRSSFYMAGAFTSYNGTAVNRIARVDQGGNLDLSFAFWLGCNGTVTGAARSLDGTNDLYVAGPFSFCGGIPATGVARLNLSGMGE